MREKHWDFFVHSTALWPVVAPVLDRFYDDGPMPTDLPGLHHHGPYANAWRYRDTDEGSLAVLRTRVLSDQVATYLSCVSDVFTHDPDTGDDPAVDETVLRDAIAARLRGGCDEKPPTPGWRSREDWRPSTPHLAPLMAGRDYDDFAPPADLDEVAAALTSAIAAAIASGVIEVHASEPYDSCSGCGGYHNVNLDCRDD